MPAIFVSDAIGADRLDLGPRPAASELSALYQASLAACGFMVRPVMRPEIYGAGPARLLLGVAPGDWHLAVKPIEHLRPFPGIPNMWACDWPFPELSSAKLGGSPFHDQVRLLRQADAVACTTGFTARVLRRAGVERSVLLPPAVPVPATGFERAEGSGCTFLSVVDQASLPRQLGATLEGFAAATVVRADLRLHIRLQGGTSADLGALRERAAPGVTVDDDGVPAPAHFLLSTHAAAGLHLPLVSAMLAGMPVVTTLGAGTGAWVSAESVVPVQTRPDLLDGDGEPIGRFLPLTSHPAEAAAVTEAVLAAAALDAAARQHLASRAREVAERLFGPAAFRDGLHRLLATLSAPGP